MIDWFSGLVGYDSSNMRLNTLQEIAWNGEILKQYERRAPVRGSYKASILIGRNSPTEDMLAQKNQLGYLCPDSIVRIDGNPAKFLQGHNVFGPELAQLDALIQAVMLQLPAVIKPPDADTVGKRAMRVTRIDLTKMVDLGSDHAVHEYLRIMAASTRSRHRSGTILESGDTLYYGKKSTLWTLKMYCKLCELKAHPPAKGDYEVADSLNHWAEGLLRIELTLRRPEMQRLNVAGFDMTDELVWHYLTLIKGGTAKMDINTKRPQLRSHVEACLYTWVAGRDVKHIYPKATFYKFRKEILDKTGLDISLPPSPEQFKKTTIDINYLRAHEKQNVDLPEGLQAFLWKPGRDV